MKDVWLIRHAESLANIGDATSTPREIPLSQEGLMQADRLAESVTVRPDLIVISPYWRAQQTAQPLIVRFPDVATETLLVQEFTYLSIERCRGTNSRQRRPWVEEYWKRADPDYCDGGQSESFAEFIGRTDNFARQMRKADFELAFVFTHEQVIKALIWSCIRFARVMDSPSMKGFDAFMTSFKIPNTAILRTKIDDDGEIYFGTIDTSNIENDA